MTVITKDTMERHLIRAIEAHAEAVREKIIEQTVIDFEKELRKAVLSHAVELTKFYDIRSSGSELTLTVRHK